MHLTNEAAGEIAPVWRINLLGQLCAVAARGEARTVGRFRTQKTGALLAYLALHLGQPQPREIVQEVLWGDETLEAGRNALRVALHSLRKQLEPPSTPFGGVLFADRATLYLNSAACVTDVAQFEQLLKEAERKPATDDSRLPSLEAALALYAGELAPGLYDDWLVPTRERLHTLFLQALQQAARAYLDAGAFEQAVKTAQRAVQADGLSEDAARLLMQAYARLGNPAMARQQFFALTERLRAELNTTPSPATRALAAQLEQIAEAASKRLDIGANEKSAVSATPNALPAALSVQLPQTSPPSVPPVRPALSERGVVKPTVYGVQALREPQSATLPFTYTRFFGRETEKATLRKLLNPAESGDETAPVRLVTLTGVGGSGKTRLAIEAARSLGPAYTDGLFFVPLAEEQTASGVWAAIARALDLPRVPSGEYKNAVVSAVAGLPRGLLVLDNFEQVVGEGGPLVQTLLQSAPNARLLVTSRRQLEVPGERVFPVEPLPFPTTNDTEALTVETVKHMPAVQLFVDRAQTAQADFALTARTFADVVAIVEALDGVPLALELAAARVRSVRIGLMRAQLSQDANAAHRFDLLTSRQVSAKNQRHYSLWKAMAWSHENLPPPLRAFFARLSVFHGGWTIDAAQAVCNEPFAAEYLTQLRAHSLVVSENASGPQSDTENAEPRFRLLDSLRAFAHEQLASAEQNELTGRHSMYFARMAEQSQAGLLGGEQQAWLNRLDADYANLRAALGRGGTTGLRLIGYLRQYWLFHGPLRQSAETAKKIIDNDLAAENDPPARAVAINALGALYLRLGDFALALPRLEESVRLYRALSDDAGTARALSNLGILRARMGDLPGGRAAQEESLALRLRVGDKWGLAASYNNLGAVTHDMGDHQSARDAYENSLRISREIGDARGIGSALLNLANIAASAGNRVEAQARYEECLTIARQQNNVASQAITLLNLGGLLSGDPEKQSEAEARFNEAYRLYSKAGEQSLAGAALIELGRIAIDQKKWTLAHDRLSQSLGLPLTRVLFCIALETAALLYAEVGGEDAANRAVTLYGAANAQRASAHIPHQTAAHEASEAQRLHALQALLGPKVYAAAYASGQSLELEQACELARQPLPPKKARVKKTKTPTV